MKVSVSTLSLIFAAACPLIGARPAAQSDILGSVDNVDDAAATATVTVDRRFLDDLVASAAAAATATVTVYRRAVLDNVLGAGAAATATATVGLNDKDCGCPPKATSTLAPVPIHTTTKPTTSSAHATSVPGAPSSGNGSGTGTGGGNGASNGSKPPVTTTVTVTGTANGPAPTGNTCSTGPVQCCNQVQSSKSSNAAGLLGLLGIVMQGVAVPVGIDCSPITALGIASNSCSAQTVCCQNNSFNGVVAIGCTPINLAL